jgi:phosphoglucosamine mutase
VQENGIKFFDANAHKLDETIELAIETLLDEPMHLGGRPGRNFGHRVNGTAFREQYVRSLVEEHPDLDLSGIKLVLDCANGAASWYAPEVFSRLGAEVIVIHASPTGQNINENAGSEHVRRQPEDLFEMMKVHHANFGIVFDGDADRVIFVDENGNLVDGDHMLAILADFLSKQGKLLNNTVVSTTMRNGALVNYFAERKIKFVETPVGDKYIMTELMGLKRAADSTDQMGLGGEQSGHIILMDAGHATGDGIRSAIYLIRAFLASCRESLAALAESIHKYPQVIASARVVEKIPLDQLESVQVVQHGLEESLPGLTRLNLRYSGTEPKVRLMLEADNRHTEAELAAKAFELCESVQEATGTPKGSFLEVLNVTRGGLVERGG